METLELLSATTENSSFFVEHFDAFITVLITVAGFIVTYFLTKKNFKDEVKKSKLNLASEQIQTLPYDICQIMDNIISKKDEEKILDEYKSIISKVLTYGSKDAVKIAIKMQRISYANAKRQDTDTVSTIVAFSLLITQLKYDLTSEVISPESYFLLRLNDYETFQVKMKEVINKMIDELKLNSKFKV